jgi:hypothetical protein
MTKEDTIELSGDRESLEERNITAPGIKIAKKIAKKE